MSTHKMPTITSYYVLLVTVILFAQGVPVPPNTTSPCPEVFRYDEISEGKWKATVTLISDSDLHGIWVRLNTKPKLEDLEAPANYQVKYNDTPEVRLADRHEILKAHTPKSFVIQGRLIDGQIPELISVVLNGKLVCSSHKLNGNIFYSGDFDNKDYFSSLSQKVSDQTSSETQKCGKALLLWPWQAGLFREENGYSSLLCEATLISARALLTSAHCVTWRNSKRPIPTSSLTVRMKNLNVQDKNKEDTYEVEKVVVHPAFEEQTLLNDIAVLQLKSSVTIDDSMQPICLPSSSKFSEDSFILGYGFRKNKTLTNLGVVRAIPMKEQRCVELEPSYKSLMNDNNYCASYIQDHDVCIGSSGSGVMDTRSDTENIWELRGVLSIGRALQEEFKCNQNSPVLIVEVSKYLKWIWQNLV